MSKVLDRMDELDRYGLDTYQKIQIIQAEQLERIADALEKQNAGKFIPEDSNGLCKPGPSQIFSP